MAITLRDLAAKAGVSTSTVSRALRDDPRLRKETCRRIQALAKKLNYRPNPLISALSESRWKAGSSSEVTTIAWVSSHFEPRLPSDWFFSKIRSGAEDRVRDLGYKLEFFNLREPGMTEERFSDILVNRGIRGLCIAPLPAGENRLNLNWSRFSCATIGYSMEEPILHRASPHHAQGIREAVIQLRAQGYRRIGLSMNEDENRRVDYQWLAGALLAAKLYPDLHFSEFIGSDEDDVGFEDWVRSERLDVVLAATNAVEYRLKKLGLPVPSATLAWIPGSPIFGIDQRFSAVGAAAIDLIIGQLRRNETGVPEHPRVIMIDGVWRGAANVNLLPISGR